MASQFFLPPPSVFREVMALGFDKFQRQFSFTLVQFGCCARQHEVLVISSYPIAVGSFFIRRHGNYKEKEAKMGKGSDPAFRKEGRSTTEKKLPCLTWCDQ